MSRKCKERMRKECVRIEANEERKKVRRGGEKRERKEGEEKERRRVRL